MKVEQIETVDAKNKVRNRNKLMKREYWSFDTSIPTEREIDRERERERERETEWQYGVHQAWVKKG